MQIDWWTLIAQIINLVILLFLLRKFLYIPVLKAVEARQKLIADELQEAAVAKRKAQELTVKCTERLADIEAQKQNILAKANVDAEKLAQNLMQEARQQYQNAQKQWHNKLIGEQKSFESAVHDLISQYFTRFADNALSQMADTRLNDLIIAKFFDKLNSLTADEIKQIQETLKNKPSIQILSAQTIDGKNQKLLESTLQKYFDINTNAKFEYTLEPTLIGGIVLRAAEQQISWNLADYMQQFQQQMDIQMQQLLKRS
ncbi:MAG: F0F1 ATP synthase subunit delta [Alphaproteobacteria bacterium]|nr:F0F1 ATP synthase subunit delta [Alphaproteobacteria bacterium]